MKTNTTTKNNLWQARKRCGLERKQVATLLSHQSTDAISRYEKDAYLPGLRNALKLEIIYRMPIRLLFQALFEQYVREIAEIKKEHFRSFSNNNWFPRHTEQLAQEEHCFYAEILKNHVPSDAEIEIITKHIIALSNTISDYRQGRKPFSDQKTTDRKQVKIFLSGFYDKIFTDYSGD